MRYGLQHRRMENSEKHRSKHAGNLFRIQRHHGEDMGRTDLPVRSSRLRSAVQIPAWDKRQTSERMRTNFSEQQFVTFGIFQNYRTGKEAPRGESRRHRKSESPQRHASGLIKILRLRHEPARLPRRIPLTAIHRHCLKRTLRPRPQSIGNRI